MSTRSLPDTEITLRDARDFILSSRLGRRAIGCDSEPSLPLFIHDLMDALYRLVQSCHLPEFTDHGLPHLCSVVDRISRWELAPSGKDDFLCDNLDAREAGALLIATLIHDIGMLSQNPADLPADASQLKSKSHWPDIATWVRQTHVDRLEKLVRRALDIPDHRKLLESAHFARAIQIAKAHQCWPWEWSGDWTSNVRDRGLAAVVAVADLLDEDSGRCDTSTLLDHREGNLSNRAHWLRHALTANRVLVTHGRIRVDLVKPPRTGDALTPVYSAIRNHFRLVELYKTDLQHLRAAITNIDFTPSTGVPDQVARSLASWEKLPGFATEQAFCYHVLRTFLPLALNDHRRIDDRALAELRVAALESVDTRILDASDGTAEPRSEFERAFFAILGATA